MDTADPNKMDEEWHEMEMDLRGVPPPPPLPPNAHEGETNDGMVEPVEVLQEPRSSGGGDGQTYYYVEKILKDVEREDGIRYFRVKWKGYPSSENSWEPESNIVDKTLVENYFAMKMKKNKNKKKSASVSKGVVTKKKRTTPPNVELKGEKHKQPIVLQILKNKDTGALSSTSSSIVVAAPSEEKQVDEEDDADMFYVSVRNINPGGAVKKPSKKKKDKKEKEGGKKVSFSFSRRNEAPSTVTSSQTNKKKNADKVVTGYGFDNGWKVVKIMGATAPEEGEKEFHFLVKFKESDKPEFIPRTICNKFCPIEVINFYEAKMEFCMADLSLEEQT